jgi:hypothetical protein
MSQELTLLLWLAQLTEVKALVGQVGATRYVMGCISQLEDGRYFLEDLSDAVPIDVSGAETTPGFFTGELRRAGLHYERAIMAGFGQRLIRAIRNMLRIPCLMVLPSGQIWSSSCPLDTSCIWFPDRQSGALGHQVC